MSELVTRTPNDCTFFVMFDTVLYILHLKYHVSCTIPLGEMSVFIGGRVDHAYSAMQI